jgi:hypothetical protein
VLKTFRVCCLLLATLMIGGAFNAQAQFFAPMPQSEPVIAPAPAAEPAPPVPDDVRTTLMVRNAIVALSQANMTGNYAVLRDMGTPNFQITNSTARLAEIFSTLRGRRIDLAPVMFFTPKFTSGPAYQDGQVLHVAGYFPTTPEQVNFELAFQRFNEQWMIAGITVNVAPPSEGQAMGGSDTQMASDATPAPKPGDARPVRIDLSQPASTAKPAAPNAPKKPAAAKKPKPAPAQKTAAAAGAAPAAPDQAAAAPSPAPSSAPAPSPPAEQPAQKSTEFGAGWNPFGR